MENLLIVLAGGLAVLAALLVVGWTLLSGRIDRVRRQLPPGDVEEWFQLLRNVEAVALRQQDLAARFTRFQNREALYAAREAKVVDKLATETAQEAAERILGQQRLPIDEADVQIALNDPPPPAGVSEVRWAAMLQAAAVRHNAARKRIKS